MRRPAPPRTPVVIKVGSSSLARRGGGLDGAAVSRVVAQVAAVVKGGRPVALVSSGAVAAGIPALGLSERPADLPGLQVAAAVGQGRLMERYTNEFAAHDLVPGQVLLTKDVLANRAQYLHARQALERMLTVGVVPVVNENDTVAVEELRLGDNDRLAAIVSHLVGAGMLVILTDTAGLYSQDPRVGEEAELLSAVRHTDDILDELARSAAGGSFGSGGVATKVAAARMAAWSGVPTVIAPAADTDGAIRAVAGEEVGTWVEPHQSRLTARKLWIAFGQPAVGAVRIDAGAVGALVGAGRSLLPAGISEVSGEFVDGDAVEVLGPDGGFVGKGLAAMGSAALRAAAGKHSVEAGGVAIHRDDLVVLVTG
jgi:glutamate 5-kinase